MSKWWTVKQLADHYGVSERTIYDVIAGGDLPVHRFGTGRGTIRVSDDDRLQWEHDCRYAKEPNTPGTSSTRRVVTADLLEKHFGM